MEYLEDEQDFRTVQPYPSWTWANKLWNPPTPMPTDGGTYYWNEEELAWDKLRHLRVCCSSLQLKQTKLLKPNRYALVLRIIGGYPKTTKGDNNENQ
jgi:hypothetical protein